MADKVKKTKRAAHLTKKIELSSSLEGLKLLGHIITWSGGGGVKHKEVVKALDDAGLDKEMAKELLPRNAWSRAAKKLMEDRVIDLVLEAPDEIVFQFTKKAKADGEMVYKKETNLRLNKDSGKITCKVHQLEAQAQEELDKAMENRTTSDITKIVQKLFELNADLFSIRDQGGVYFVPMEHEAFMEKVHSFLSSLGGRMNPFPVPAGTNHGDKSVQEAMEAHFVDLVRDYSRHIDAFGVDTRATTIELAASRIREAETKIVAYADYFAEKKEALLKSMKEAKKKLEAKIEEIAVLRPEKEDTPRTKGYIFGWPSKAVVKWMRDQKWTFEEVRKALDDQGCEEFSNGQIKKILASDKDEDSTPPAKLSEEQEADLDASRSK